MVKEETEIAVLYKHVPAERKKQSWSLAQPNLAHKPLTQDQIRETSMKYLTHDQKRHFELNSELNKRGSLFGPRRDQAREKTPPDVAEEKRSTKLSVNSANSMVPGEAPSKASFGTTALFPMTNASIRGSEVAEDMRLLSSMMPSAANIQSTLLSTNPMAGMSVVSLDTRKRTLDLDKATPFRIDDWLKLEQSGEYLGKRKHFLRVINTLDYDEKVMQVKNYQLVHELVDFYAENYNSNAHNYVWKDIWGNTLRMYKSLAENGLMDNSLIIDELGLDHFPTILIYFMDGFQDEPLMRLDINKVEPDGIKVPCRNY